METTTKHTPGPWLVIFDDAAVRLFESREAAVDEARRVDEVTDGNVRTTVLPLALADAAPDLLATLRAFLRAPHVGSDGPGSSTITIQDFHLRDARAAIAKAAAAEIIAAESE